MTTVEARFGFTQNWTQQILQLPPTKCERLRTLDEQSKKSCKTYINPIIHLNLVCAHSANDLVSQTDSPEKDII